MCTCPGKLKFFSTGPQMRSKFCAGPKSLSKSVALVSEAHMQLTTLAGGTGLTALYTKHCVAGLQPPTAVALQACWP